MSEPNKMLILIDSNYLAYYHSFRNRYFSHDGKPTNVVFGFLKSLLSLSREFDTDRFVFAWDSRKSLRKIWLSIYKGNRVKTEEEEIERLETFRQMAELRENILPKFGFQNVFQKTGYEADDLIARICKDNLNEKIAIISSDNDLYQLLTDNHFMYDIKRKTRYTKDHFTRNYDIPPEQWSEVKSIAGCQGDNVPGVPGVGVKTAVKYVRGKLSSESKMFKRIEDAKADGTVAETLSLIELPFLGLGSFHLELVETFELKDFLSICDEFGFRSFINASQVWQEQFDMKV